MKSYIFHTIVEFFALVREHCTAQIFGIRLMFLAELAGPINFDLSMLHSLPFRLEIRIFNMTDSMLLPPTCSANMREVQTQSVGRVNYELWSGMLFDTDAACPAYKTTYC